MRRFRWVVAIVAAGIALACFEPHVRQALADLLIIFRGRATCAMRLEQYGNAARSRLAPHFRKAGIKYPPDRLVFVGFKHEKRLEIYSEHDGKRAHIRDYPVLAASGDLGPKLCYGDGQVPEGIYRVQWLNPNSRFHLSMRLDYPNEFDRDRASEEGRGNLGGDIMIHGGCQSCGCLAVGDEASEDLFVLAADVGVQNIKVILSPVDFRARDLPPGARRLPGWTKGLYEQIKRELTDGGLVRQP